MTVTRTVTVVVAPTADAAAAGSLIGRPTAVVTSRRWHSRCRCLWRNHGRMNRRRGGTIDRLFNHRSSLHSHGGRVCLHWHRYSLRSVMYYRSWNWQRDSAATAAATVKQRRNAFCSRATVELLKHEIPLSNCVRKEASRTTTVTALCCSRKINACQSKVWPEVGGKRSRYMVWPASRTRLPQHTPTTARNPTTTHQPVAPAGPYLVGGRR